jgi:hypothetical protein
MRPPARIKDVQKLAGCLAVLNQFISRLAERALLFFKLLWKSGPFIWSNDAEEAFQELKRYLTSPPVMVVLEPSEPLLLYIVATSEAVSMVLVAERPDPHGLHELGSSSANGSGSQDPGPMEEPGAVDGSGSSDPGPAKEPGATDGSESSDPGPADEPGAANGSQSPEVAMGPLTRESRGLELPPGTKGWELPRPTPMEMDAPDPPPREGPNRPTSDVLHHRGPPRSQDKIPGGPQAALCSPHRLQEAMPLLPGSQDLSGDLKPYEGHPPQP